jgi:serine/threonine protein kinase
MSAKSMEEVEPEQNQNQGQSSQQQQAQSSPQSGLPDDVTKMRSIGRWYIGETLGKGGYSWVKKGYDKKTGKCVALKFMAKAESSWADEQTKQVITEIESLKQIRHEHVMKLYAYNLNAKYPTKTKEKIECILLVLEYAPGGELFDILYYTSALEEILARTYFRQMIYGLEACHNAGIAHRDIKPQNLLLDSKFNLKLTDFGLSKVFESDADAIMKTTYVGTRGYQAPELLLNQPYDLSCDIFSAGVVLFILLTGYPPFEQAQSKDRWFSPLTHGDTSKFWKLHRGCNISNDEKVKDLIQRMIEFDPKKRIAIADIKKT